MPHRRWWLALACLLIMILPAWAQGQASIRLFGYDDKTGDVVLYLDRAVTPQSFHLDSPLRWVVDLPGTRYTGATQTLPAIEGTPVRAVRISQFKTGVVRLVFDLETDREFPSRTEQVRPGTYRLAFAISHAGPTPAPKPTQRAQQATPVPRATPAPRPTVKPVRGEEADAPDDRPRATVPDSQVASVPAGLSLRRVRNGWQLTISTQDPVSYTLVQQKRMDRLVFDLVGGGSELPKDSLYVDNGLIARVRALPLNQNATRLIVEFDQALRFSVSQSTGRKVLLVNLGGAATGSSPQVSSPRRDPNERRVTIDPGHGGLDAGTLGGHGTKEKDVTLQVATRLQRLMQESGMDVQMTRNKDMQILLHPRVEVGDAFDSDVFISIHANHISDPSVQGIETYYFTPHSLALARAVHKRMVTILQRPDRGVRRNNFVVVKYNKMPACLVEIGFLSNPNEEKLLTTPAYQERTAEAILAGVQDYFRNRSLRQ